MMTAPGDSQPRLLCPICGYEEPDSPKHCGEPMSWVLEGGFRKTEKLECSACKLRIDVPEHCGVKMWYSTSDYHDLPSPTPLDQKSMKDALS